MPDPSQPAAPTADATTMPKPPDYITDTEKEQVITFFGQQVQLYNLSFLGIKFQPQKGVNAEMARRLIDAQTHLYYKCFAEKQKERQQSLQDDPNKNIPEITKIEENDFKEWCWLGQEPGSSGHTQVGSHLGLKDKESRHASGSAMDINGAGNPYPPSRSFVKGSMVLGGEIQTQNAKRASPPLPDMKDFRLFHEQNIWQPAIDIYDRAHSLFYGTSSDTHVDDDFDHAVDLYLRFKRVSYAISAYFRFAFPDGQSAARQPRSFDEFKTQFMERVENDLIHPDALNIDLTTRLLPLLNSAQKEATLQAYYNQIVADYIPMQRATVSGNLIISKDGTIDFPPGPQRDPCHGIFNVRQEVFVELVQVQRLRWGGAMFGPAGSGDNMHFDLNGHFLNGQRFELVRPAKGSPKELQSRSRIKGDPPEQPSAG